VTVPRWVADARRLVEALPEEVVSSIERHEATGHTGCLEYQGMVHQLWKRHVCRLAEWPDSLERALAGFGVDVYETMSGPFGFRGHGQSGGGRSDSAAWPDRGADANHLRTPRRIGSGGRSPFRR
jgi:hypothetical protein